MNFRRRSGELHLLRLYLGIKAVIGEAGRNQRQPTHRLGMLHGEPEGRAAAERIAEHVDFFIAEFLQQRGQVVADIRKADVPIAERRAAVAVKVDRDHLPAFGQLRQ